jgi:transposase InsO family protein
MLRQLTRVPLVEHTGIFFDNGIGQEQITGYEADDIRVRALLTDNGSSYRSHQFRSVCQQLGLQHSRTRPYSPQTNGKAERFIQTALCEWAYATHWRDSTERNLAFLPWNHYYNHQRPHGSLNYQPPISRSEPRTTS